MSLVLQCKEVVAQSTEEKAQFWDVDTARLTTPLFATRYPADVQWEQYPPEGCVWAPASVLQ